MSNKKIFDILPPGERTTKAIPKAEKNIKPTKKSRTKKSPLRSPSRSSSPRLPSFKLPCFKIPSFNLPLPFAQSSLRIKILFGISVVLIGFAVFLHLSSTAEIEIIPKTENLSFEEEIVVDTNALNSNFSKRTILGRFLSAEKKIAERFPSTGEAKNQGKASGRLKVVNNYHLDQVLVEKTRFLSADGKLFYLKDGVNIPAGTSQEVRVEAAEPGPEYNIKPTTFSIPGLLGSSRYTAVYAESIGSMEEGFRGEVAQVTEKDLENAERALYDKLLANMKQDFENQLGSSFSLLGEAIRCEVSEKSSSVDGGEETEDFEFNLKMACTAIAFKEEYLKDFARYAVIQRTSENKEIKESTFVMGPSIDRIDIGNGKLFLRVKISTDVFEKIDIDGLKKALSGKSIKESEVFLRACPEIQKTRLRISPFWLQKIPQELDRIEARIITD